MEKKDVPYCLSCLKVCLDGKWKKLEKGEESKRFFAEISKGTVTVTGTRCPDCGGGDK